jgi:hypothetical protein
MNTRLIAACGMNCGICLGYLREKNRCPGCRGRDESKPKYCVGCVIAHCPILKESNWTFCSDRCPRYPCRRLRDLDKRYRTRYGMSMLENLENIRKRGVRRFVQDEKARWTCPSCGTILCVHRKICLGCGAPRPGINV